MRQGQQNRRGRGRSNNNTPTNHNSSNNNNSNNNNNNNRKPQNPLSRNFESSGPDVKIRGTAAQIAEKYVTLARDAASSGDYVMSENYLQHAEHYNRIIMAAQAQAAAASMGHPGVENGHALNGTHRGPGEGGQSMRDQPQPQMHQPSAPQPQVQSLGYGQPADNEPALGELPDFIQQPVREPKADVGKESAPGDTDPARRRRRRYTANGTARAGSPEAANGNGEAVEISGDAPSSD